MWLKATHNHQNKTQENADTVEFSIHKYSAWCIEKNVRKLLQIQLFQECVLKHS